MALQFKQRMTKSAFEQRIMSDLGSDGITAKRHSERDAEKTNNMTLYYKNNVHVGTWMSGEGWAFKSAYK